MAMSDFIASQAIRLKTFTLSISFLTSRHACRPFVTIYTFETCGATSYVGPTLNMCLATYGTINSQWTQDATIFMGIGNGSQIWTVPMNGAEDFQYVYSCVLGTIIELRA